MLMIKSSSFVPALNMSHLKIKSKKNIPYLGLVWNREIDNIAFNGSFTIAKKNSMGQAKFRDLSDIPKDKFKDIAWLKPNITKRVILRLTMGHYDPFGCMLSVSLTNFKIFTSKIMEMTETNRYDDPIEDEPFLR